MIRFSAALVAVAIGVLIGGIATSKLLLVYIAIAVSAVALVALVTGVVLRREELFGERQGPVPAKAGAGPGLPAHVGDSQGTVPSSGYVAPPPPPAGAAAGYGVPFGGVAQATASPGPGLTTTRQGARHSRPEEPVPPWEAAATRESWVPDWAPAAKDQRAASGAGVRAPSAWQDTAAVTAAGSWGGANAPKAGTASADAPNADARAATAPPQAWAAPPTMPTPVPADAPDAGPEAAPPSWFDRLGQSADTDTPIAPSGSAPGSGSGWAWSSQGTSTSDGPVAQEEPAAPAAGSGDEDDDWPTRYSWLDDEPDENNESNQSVETGPSATDDQGGDKAGKASAAAEATVAASTVAVSESAPPAETSSDAATKASPAPKGKAKARASTPKASPAKASPPAASASVKARDAETAARATTDQEPAAEEPSDAATDETVAPVIAFRSRKAPEPKEPTPASDAAKQPGTADKSADKSAAAGAELQAAPDAEPAAGPADEPAAAPTAEGAALVAVVRGVPRYHEPDCVLIRFMPEGDLQKLTIPQAKEDGCTPCGACQPAG